MANTQNQAAGIEISNLELIRARPPRNMTGFAPSGRVHTHQWGSNQSNFFGRGMEFAESRSYQPGDDVKNIDWRVTARTGEPHTKLFQEERERPVYILLDMRSMMQFGSRKRFKSNLAAEIAAQLAWVGHDGGDRVGGLILTRTGIRDFRVARTRRSVLQFIEAMAEETRLGVEPGQEVGLAEALKRLGNRCQPGSLVFVVSDFYDLNAAAETELKHFAGRSHTITIMVNDPLDQALPSGGGRISNGSSVLALAGLGRKPLQEYTNDFLSRQQSLATLCRKTGIVFHSIATSDDPKSLLNPKRPRAKRRLV